MTESNVQIKHLSNGIPVVFECLPHVRSVSFKVHVAVGTRYETPENHGVAHFLEHMLFKGTKQRSSFDIANEIERFGGMFNAYTSKEETMFYTSGVDEALNYSIDVISDMLLNSKMKASDITQEKMVVLEEIKGAFDNPEDIIWDYFTEELLAPDVVGKPTLGTKETVKGLTREMILSFWKQNYCADNITIVAVGNILEEPFLEHLERTFGKFERGIKNSHTILETNNLFERVYERDITQSHIVLGKRVCDYVNEDKFPLILLNNILGSGMSSRMFQNIREKYGFAYSVYSSMDFYTDHGIFYSYIGTDATHVDESKSLIQKEIQTFLDGNIADQEIEDVKLQVKGGILLGLESNGRRAERLLRQYLNYDAFISVDEQLNKFQRITKETLIETARKYLNPEEMACTIIRSKKTK